MTPPEFQYCHGWYSVVGPLPSCPFLLLFSLSQQLDITKGSWVLRWRIWVLGATGRCVCSPDCVVGHHIIPLGFSPLCPRGSACSGHFRHGVSACVSFCVCHSSQALFSQGPSMWRVRASLLLMCSYGRALSGCLAIYHLADPSPVGRGAVFNFWLVWVMLL